MVMRKYVSLLRGINVSGQKKIKMEELRALYESLNLKKIKTYVQSGNVIFECPDSNISELTSKIERKIKQTFYYSVTVIIRTKNEFKHLIDNNPFYGERKEDITKLHVTFLADTPSDSSLGVINELEDKSAQLAIAGKEIYLFCPNGYARTKLTNSYFEEILNVSATTRNWKTVNKLYDLVKEDSE